MKNLTQQKNNKLATEFFEYIEKYKKDNNGKYPEYSSSNKYYNDVYINLLICQNGLCAYSEMFIYEYYEKCQKNDYWKNGRYVGEKLKIGADIEHFLAKSLCNLECDWKWSNLFLVDTKINRDIKKNKPVYAFMRPDNPEYDPLKYLVYDIEMNFFVPKYTLDKETRVQVKEMLKTLGINSDGVWAKRKSKLQQYLENAILEDKNFASLKKEVKEFYTAFVLCKDIFENEQKIEHFLNIKN